MPNVGAILEQPVRAKIDSAECQVVDIVVHHGYHPHSIRAKAGVPLRIVFHRTDDDVCSERVVFSTPKLDRRLAATGMTSIELPGQPPGEVRFTCGMGRYRGRIELVDDRSWSLAGRVRERAMHLDPRLGTALLLYCLFLPLAALVLFGLDGTSALVVAGVVFLASIGVWMWLSSRLTRTTHRPRPCGRTSDRSDS